LLRRRPADRPLRVALDGPRCAGLAELAAQVAERLQALGSSTAVVVAQGFYRDASLRFEHGKTDVESFYSGWLDTAALQREVLRPLGASGGSYLPSLRDPATNRATRAEPVALADDGVLLVVGELLLGAGLSFDVVLHADLSRQARKRRTPDEHHWTLPAFDRYDIDVDPAAWAHLLLRWDDPAHPALMIRG